MTAKEWLQLVPYLLAGFAGLVGLGAVLVGSFIADFGLATIGGSLLLVTLAFVVASK